MSGQGWRGGEGERQRREGGRGRGITFLLSGQGRIHRILIIEIIKIIKID